MQIRSEHYPEDGARSGGHQTALSWRVPGRNMAPKIVALVAFATVGAFSLGDPPRMLCVAVGLVVAGAALVRDVMAPVRLAADQTGITVLSGFSGLRHLPWTDIERIRTDRHQRMGRTIRLVEIDTGETLHLFGAAELGAEPEEVVAILLDLWSRSGGSVVAEHEDRDVVDGGLPGEAQGGIQ